MSSVGRRIEYAEYHYRAARAIQEQRDQRIREAPSPAKERLTYNAKYPEDRLAAEAHFVACFQSMHALFDLFLFGAYHALFFTSASATLIDAKLVKWGTVAPLLKGSSETRTLHDGLNAWRRKIEFKYLDALVNSSKHRAVIRTRHWIVLDCKDDEGSPPRFDGFEFNGTTYPREEALPTTARTWDVVTRAVIDSGIELERVLRGRLRP